MQPTQQQLDELVHRIVEAVHPIRIVLFGSLPRGETGAPGSPESWLRFAHSDRACAGEDQRSCDMIKITSNG